MRHFRTFPLRLSFVLACVKEYACIFHARIDRPRSHTHVIVVEHEVVRLNVAEVVTTGEVQTELVAHVVVQPRNQGVNTVEMRGEDVVNRVLPSSPVHALKVRELVRLVHEIHEIILFLLIEKKKQSGMQLPPPVFRPSWPNSEFGFDVGGPFGLNPPVKFACNCPRFRVKVSASRHRET
jgi:hypothetical protein